METDREGRLGEIWSWGNPRNSGTIPAAAVVCLRRRIGGVKQREKKEKGVLPLVRLVGEKNAGTISRRFERNEGKEEKY
ncbi:hypothetical protein ACLOJK_027851, partial [Asimina triloba]